VTVGRSLAAAGVALLGLLAVVAYTVASGPTTVQVVIERSAFAPTRIHVPAGRPVVFELVNRDFIDHEWIVATDEVHAAHRTGTEPHHASRPTEVTVPAFETRTTTVTFAERGELRFVCHLPGHEAYGMAGVVIVE
jgi:uncharacterized cupredoxin-like copper-binding protein